jgi:predicted phage terminase large subunit-like protein
LELALAHLSRAKSLAAGTIKQELEVPEIIRLARTDFGVFCEVFDKPPAAHHREWHREIVTNQDSSQLLRIAGPNLAILAPRGSAKSTTLAMLPSWLIGVHGMQRMMLRMLYLGYSLDIARSRSHTIKTIITSQKYREIFPMISLSKARQSDELWSIDFDVASIEANADDPYTLVGQGLSGSITSRRSQLIILDDVIKSSESIQNPAIRRKLITNWTEVVQPTLLEGGRAIALGTRYSPVDIFATTFNEKNGWKVKTQQAIVADENGIEASYWPEMYSLDHLQKLRREDPIAFAFQFQNKPVSKSEVDFPEDWLRLGELTQSYDALTVGIDLSSALKERSDWTVMLLAGRIDDRIEFIDYRRMRMMGNLEKIDAFCEMLLDWGIIEMEEQDGGREQAWYSTDAGVMAMVEAISYQQSMKADAEAVVRHQRGLHNVTFRPVTSWRGDKLTRLRGTFGLFQMGKVTWNRWINWDPFWNELLNYGNADNDDCPDAMVLAIKGLVGQGQVETAWGEWDALD